jgi:hypothetical protein
MKNTLYTILFALSVGISCAQNNIDSLILSLKTEKEDTNKVNHLMTYCGS